NGKKIIVVLPAYNAEETLESTFGEIPLEIIDDVILVDDHSTDKTAELSQRLNIETIVHPQNRGYGANQKTCYHRALEKGADIVVMLHPDYQYTPKLLAALVSMVAYGVYDAALGSRILGKGALAGGMPLYKYAANRLLTFVQNVLISQKFSEYHTGYRAFSREALRAVPFEKNSDDFIFDNEIIAQMVFRGVRIGEISCPTLYAEQCSSINFQRSVKYGLGVLAVSCKFFLQKRCGWRFALFEGS
ncbi:MAG TPA: glycosyltransferase family 2 protein, partial [Oligoflexia bacterium]|nr:glycosyltransferase family 2 protein [Oligoflexia bacterium]